jgi:hypothetical protein
MVRTLALAVAGCLLIVTAASADVPLPNDLQYVDPRVSFEGIDKHADYVFHLRYLTFSGGPGGVPHRLVEVKDARPFNLNAERRLMNMSLLAMPRQEFDKRAKEDPSLTWLTDKTEGVLQAGVTPPSTTAPAGSKEVPVTTYRVAIRDGKLTVEMVEDHKQGEATPPPGLWPVWVLGVVSACCLAWFGVWFARRRGRGAR